MAIVTQLVCLLMKYGTVKSGATLTIEASARQAEYQRKSLHIQAGLWDWFRCLVAFKMSASSLNTIFLSIPRFEFLARPAFVITAIAALLSLVGAIVFARRLLNVHQKLKDAYGGAPIHAAIDKRRVYGGVLYFNPADSALFAQRYIFNFANKWVYVFIGCIIAYPLLVFLPD